jgi:ADP-ribose pyrophosphatase YjhB (NUDIX family)
MANNLIQKLWKITPSPVRLRVIRTMQKKFTASVVAIVINEKQEVLVLDHYFRPRASWGLPGGFIDPDEDTDNAIKRELREETNLKLEDLKLIKVRTIKKHLEILYLAKGIGEAIVNSSEIKEVGWFDPDKMPDEMSDVQKEIVREVLKNSTGY